MIFNFMHNLLIIHTKGNTPPTDVTAEQTSQNTVLVMWTAPSPPPADGYQVLITRGSTTTTNVAGTSHTFTVNNHYGVYSIQVRSLSQHFQTNREAEPIYYTIRGKSEEVGHASLIVTTCLVLMAKIKRN